MCMVGCVMSVGDVGGGVWRGVGYVVGVCRLRGGGGGMYVGAVERCGCI